MENGTEPASRFNSEREREIQKPPGSTGGKWDGMDERGTEEGRKEAGQGHTLDSTCALHGALPLGAPQPLGREGEALQLGSARLRTGCRKGPRPGPLPASSPRPPPPPLPAPAPRVLPPPPGAERKRAAADLPRWHRSHKPARNCKANKAEILDWSQSWQDLRFCRQFVCAALFKGPWLRKCWK